MARFGGKRTFFRKIPYASAEQRGKSYAAKERGFCFEQAFITPWTILVEVDGRRFRKFDLSARGRALVIHDRPPSSSSGLTGDFCTSGSEREFTLKERWYANEEIQARADCDAAAAD
jgi:hypothetical protein